MVLWIGMVQSSRKDIPFVQRLFRGVTKSIICSCAVPCGCRKLPSLTILYVSVNKLMASRINYRYKCTACCQSILNRVVLTHQEMSVDRPRHNRAEKDENKHEHHANQQQDYNNPRGATRRRTLCIPHVRRRNLRHIRLHRCLRQIAFSRPSSRSVGTRLWSPSRQRTSQFWLDHITYTT